MLRLKEELMERIKEHGRRSYPEECCGFLMGSSDGHAKVVRDILELSNSMQENRSRRYIVTPEEYREAEDRAQKLHLELLGVYHSHPDHPSRPSQFDLDHALPWWSYIIVAVDRGLPKEAGCWSLRDDRSGFDREPIEVETHAPAMKSGVGE
jgi:proteasome lid subunit RPN8/RPN11